MVHSHTFRPLAELTDEQLQFLDEITRKLSPKPVLNASRDGTGNQSEIKQAEVVTK
jgi:hypothetical protein